MKTFATLVTAAMMAVGINGQAGGLLGDNPWLERRVLNIAHRGGGREFPENTLFAYHQALAKGATMLETDVYLTSDGRVVVIHDATVDRTTDGAGAIGDMTLAEIKALDAAHWYVPGEGIQRDRENEDDYIYRGVAQGSKEPPAATDTVTDPSTEAVRPPNAPEDFVYRPEDFQIPTLEEFLEAFPDEFMVIELKPSTEDIGVFEMAVADILLEYGRVDDVTIASFLDTSMEVFKAYAPEIHTSFPTGQAARWVASSQGPAPGTPARHRVLQVPIALGIEVVTEDFIQDAHANNLAVQVFTINDRETMERLVDWGVDGIMTDVPTLFSEILEERGLTYERPAPERTSAASTTTTTATATTGHTTKLSTAAIMGLSAAGLAAVGGAVYAGVALKARAAKELEEAKRRMEDMA